MKKLPKHDHQFYPTPPMLAVSLRSMIDWSGVNVVCDPSAGKGDLLDLPAYGYGSSTKRWAIEIDPDLQAILREKNIQVIGSDFLTFDGREQPDVFLMNPPFADGAAHLLRAINYLFSGQIACILNAETLKNPHTNERKLLVQELDRMGAKIQYKSNAFLDAERKTGVEIAIVYIDKRIDLGESIFADCKDQAEELHVDVINEQSKGLVHADRIKAIVERYNDTKERGIKLILDFYKKARKVPYVGLSVKDLDTSSLKNPDSTAFAKQAINQYLLNLRQGEWRDLMRDPAIEKFLTSKKKEQYHKEIEAYSSMDITEANIRDFVSRISAEYSSTLTDAVMELFDRFTFQHAWYTETKKNIYLFNGWKTNNSFKVNKKVILPNMLVFSSWDGSLERRLSWKIENQFSDFDKVMSYFDGGRQPISEDNPLGYMRLSDAVNEALNKREYQNIESEYFIATFYKKGTLHLTFRNQDVLRRFNVFCCTNKGWLPCDYAQREYAASEARERAVVESFEGVKNYKVDSAAQPFKHTQSLGGNAFLLLGEGAA